MVNEFDVKFESGKYYSYVGMASDSGNLNHDDCPDINSQTLKIDVEMAIAMTEGYKKNGDMFRTCIMSSSPRSKALEKDFVTIQPIKRYHKPLLPTYTISLYSQNRCRKTLAMNVS